MGICASESPDPFLVHSLSSCYNPRRLSQASAAKAALYKHLRRGHAIFDAPFVVCDLLPKRQSRPNRTRSTREGRLSQRDVSVLRNTLAYHFPSPSSSTGLTYQLNAKLRPSTSHRGVLQKTSESYFRPFLETSYPEVNYSLVQRPGIGSRGSFHNKYRGGSWPPTRQHNYPCCGIWWPRKRLVASASPSSNHVKLINDFGWTRISQAEYIGSSPLCYDALWSPAECPTFAP